MASTMQSMHNTTTAYGGYNPNTPQNAQYNQSNSMQPHPTASLNGAIISTNFLPQQQQQQYQAQQLPQQSSNQMMNMMPPNNSYAVQQPSSNYPSLQK